MRSHLSLLLLATIASCAQPAEAPAEEATTREADVEAINSLRDDFVAAVGAGDSSSVAALYSNDAVLMPRNESAVRGREPIESWFLATYEKFSEELNLSEEEVEIAGDWAFEWGIYRATITPKAEGEPIQDQEGKYVVILQRQADGSWKMRHQIWNISNPTPGTQEE